MPFLHIIFILVSLFIFLFSTVAVWDICRVRISHYQHAHGHTTWTGDDEW